MFPRFPRVSGGQRRTSPHSTLTTVICITRRLPCTRSVVPAAGRTISARQGLSGTSVCGHSWTVAMVWWWPVRLRRTATTVVKGRLTPALLWWWGAERRRQVGGGFLRHPRLASCCCCCRWCRCCCCVCRLIDTPRLSMLLMFPLLFCSPCCFSFPSSPLLSLRCPLPPSLLAAWLLGPLTGPCCCSCVAVAAYTG